MSPGFHQYDLQDDNIDDGIHLDTNEVEITLRHPHSFMEIYGWIPQMSEGISELTMSVDEPCVEFNIKIVSFKVCKYERGVTMNVGAFGLQANFVECRDVRLGCAVNPVDSPVAGKVGVKGICLKEKVNLAMHLCIGPVFGEPVQIHRMSQSESLARLRLVLCSHPRSGSISILFSSTSFSFTVLFDPFFLFRLLYILRLLSFLPLPFVLFLPSLCLFFKAQKQNKQKKIVVCLTGPDYLFIFIVQSTSFHLSFSLSFSLFSFFPQSFFYASIHASFRHVGQGTNDNKIFAHNNCDCGKETSNERNVFIFRFFLWTRGG